MKIKDPNLYKLMKSLLADYLPVIRQKSEHTVTAYRDAINLFTRFLDEENAIKMKDLSVSDFNSTSITSFLKWLKEHRGNTSTTINQRLSHIKGFCKYMHKKGFLPFDSYGEICEIAEYRDDRTREFVWLSIDEVKFLIIQPDTSKKTGIRDRFFLALMYESGCRDDELLHLRTKDMVFNASGEPSIHIFGKGSKHSLTPLSKEIVPYYNEYFKLYHSDDEKKSDDLFFYTMRNGVRCQMSQDNVQRFMKNYGNMARKTIPGLPHIHPHLFRTTRAMHLYLAGVPLPLIAEWLGHSNMETTQIYARATDEMKRQAQKKLGDKMGAVFEDDVAFKYANDEDALKKLAGLR